MNRQKATPVLDVVVKDFPEVEGGRFRVADDGRVYRKRKGGGWELSPQSAHGRNGMYSSVSYTENGEQTQYAVHRLVATAYIENPDNLPEVNHKDGNGRNNRVSNLEWTTRRGNTEHAYKNGLIPTNATAGVPCLQCGELTLSRDGFCANCKAQKRLALSQKQAKEERANKALTILSTLGGAKLSERDCTILQLYSEGKTYREIGEKLCISKQRVEQIIHNMKPEPEYINRDLQKDIAHAALSAGCLASKLSRSTGLCPRRIKEILTLRQIMTTDECEKIAKAAGIIREFARADSTMSFVRKEGLLCEREKSYVSK